MKSAHDWYYFDTDIDLNTRPRSYYWNLDALVTSQLSDIMGPIISNTRTWFIWRATNRMATAQYQMGIVSGGLTSSKFWGVSGVFPQRSLNWFNFHSSVLHPVKLSTPCWWMPIRWGYINFHYEFSSRSKLDMSVHRLSSKSALMGETRDNNMIIAY